MHFRSSSTFALLAAALTLGAAAEAGAQQIPRGGKEPAPCVCDTVRITRVDTVTVWRNDTVRVTRYDTVHMEPPVVIAPVRTWGSGFYWGLGGGISSPNRDFRNYEPGWNVTGMVGVDPVNFPIGWRIDASYDQWAERDNSAYPADPTVFSINGDLKLRVPLFRETINRFAIYGLGGLTYGRYKDVLVGPRTDATVTAANAASLNISTESIDNWVDKWGWNAGGGLSFGVGNSVDLFVESRFIAVTWDTDQSYVPVIAGFTWSL